MSIKNYGVITSIDELASFCRRLIDHGGPISIDCETGYTGPDQEKASVHPETAILVGISFTVSTDWARYVPLAHDTGENLDNREVARLFWPVLATGRAVAHNGSFELRNLSRWFVRHLSDDPEFGEAVRASDGYFPIFSDTQVEAYLVAEYPKFGLKYLTKQMFDHTMTDLYDLFPGLPINRRKFLRFNVLELTPQVIEYACEDAVWCLAIHERYYPQVKDRYLYQVEMEILQCVCEMEDFGIAYDWAFLRAGADKIREFRDHFHAEIMLELGEMTGGPVAISLASPAQVSDILYNRLGLKTRVFTETTRNLPPSQRKMSTGKIALAGLAKRYPVVKKITQWKEMTRLLGTYLEKYETLYNYAPDGRVHPSHLSAVVITGRFAVTDPPYQGSPKVYHFDLAPALHAHEADVEPSEGTCFRFNFRDAICAPPEHYMLGFDLSQAELRAIAGEAQEQALLKAFATGQDVHTLTAALMLNIPIESVTKELRAIGKTMNFALLYGMQAKSLADRLGMEIEEAQKLYDAYFAAYPGIAAWAEKQVAFGKAHGYVTSKFGRRLPIWEYQSDKRWVQEKGDRACVNYPIQGAATGDTMKIAMVRARKALHKAGLADRVHMVMNVHDALEFYVHDSLTPQEVITVLQPAVVFPIAGWPPMAAEWHFGKRWGSPTEIEITTDGKFLVKGEKEYELRPTEEVDEETGELVIELPDELDPEVLRQATTSPAATATRSPDAGRNVVIVLSEMPRRDGYLQFKQFLTQRPGPNTITLRTPEGETSLPHRTGIGPADVARLSLLLGPVQVLYDTYDVDNAELMQGLTL